MARNFYACGCKFKSTGNGDGFCPIHAERCVAQELDFKPVELRPTAIEDFPEFCRFLDALVTKAAQKHATNPQTER